MGGPRREPRPGGVPMLHPRQRDLDVRRERMIHMSIFALEVPIPHENWRRASSFVWIFERELVRVRTAETAEEKSQHRRLMRSASTGLRSWLHSWLQSRPRHVPLLGVSFSLFVCPRQV